MIKVLKLILQNKVQYRILCNRLSSHLLHIYNQMNSEFILKVDDLTNRLNNIRKVKVTPNAASILQTKMNRIAAQKNYLLQNIANRTVDLEKQSKISIKVNQQNQKRLSQSLQAKQDLILQQLSKKRMKVQQIIENMQFELREIQIDEQIAKNQEKKQKASKIQSLARQIENEIFILSKETQSMQRQCEDKRNRVNKRVDQSIKDIELLLIERTKKSGQVKRSIRNQLSKIQQEFNKLITKTSQQFKYKDETTKKILQNLFDLI